MNQFRSVSAAPTRAHIAAAQRMIGRTMQAAVPVLADFCFVHVADTREVTCIAAAHRDPDGARTLRALLRLYRVRRSDRESAVAHVLRTGQPLLRTEIRRDAAPPRHGRAAMIAGLHERLGARCALVVPITVRSQVIGTFSLGRSYSERRFAQSDVAPALRLAVQIGYVLLMATAPGGVPASTAARRSR